MFCIFYHRLCQFDIMVRLKNAYCYQVAQLSQRDHTAGWVSFGQKWKTGTGRQYFADIRGLSSSLSHWKARSGLPISVNRIFLLGVTAEALRANID